jgi:recombination protein RecR
MEEIKGLPLILKEAIDRIAELPGYGERSAQKLILNLLNMPRGEAKEIVENLKEVLDKITECKICGLYTDKDICSICSDESRDRSTICVVEESFDAFAIERTGRYDGLYHVLGGRLSPLEGIQPEDLNIDSLLKRLENEDIKEVILATNPTVEGEATATYIYNLIKDKDILITRIAYGLPFGGILENADEFTLSKALENKIRL